MASQWHDTEKKKEKKTTALLGRFVNCLSKHLQNSRKEHIASVAQAAVLGAQDRFHEDADHGLDISAANGYK